MQSGRERLRAWITRSKVNQTEAAKILGVGDVQLCQWLSGARTPNLDSAILIEDVTGVSVRSWGLTRESGAREAVPAGTGKQRFSRR